MKRVVCAAAAALTLAMSAAMPSSAATEIMVAYENNPGEPVDRVMTRWAELVEERSGGDVVLTLYPSSQLGAKRDVMEQAMMGVNVITLTDVGFLQDFDADLGILFGPYLTDSPEKLFEIYESDWFKQKKAELESKGVHIVISNYLYGVRQLLATKPVETPADMAGLKVRTPNNIMQIRAIEAMGGTATPMPLGDVYPALTTGLIEGVENPIPVLYGAKLHEQAKYLSMISYLTNTSLWVGGQAFFDTLPDDVVTMLEETGYEAGVYSQQIAAEQDAELIEKMKAAGVTVIEPDVEAFREATKSVYEQFPKWSPGLYETIQDQLK
ncbi:C4-dicarboxylate TRAP transporter substrate-binding protein [Roseospira visakhapatnamensis]|uniref:Tripartite ATP-independent transporter DctP family solute receptor n=1 Tax=Roseospira visakhapatnamensis TaxID=390880 RepID=A0A7W6W9E7_9PROT|nr:C4-dicarboxylate TRAP transporter substrate-binding protein [Roseospira visakhapatnamensis]MBB4265789.1 tripartite ATP-independent transporter DctP family solute receptor [Roseospira visakhapatnamensis]